MASITPLSSGRGLPDLTMVEFAIMISLLRLGPNPAPILLETLSEWFGQTVGLSDLKPGLRRLMHQGMLVQDPNGSLRPMPPSAAPVATCFAAAIRIVGTEFRRALDKGDPPLIDHIMRQSRESADRDKNPTVKPGASPDGADDPPKDKE